MEQKKSKISSAEPGASEYWVAGGPLWINFANSRVLAKLGMTDATDSADSLSWWLGLMGLSAPDRLREADLAFAAGLRDSFSRTLDSLQAGTTPLPEHLALFNSVLKSQKEWYQLGQGENGLFVKQPYRSVDTIEQAFGPVVDSLSETLVNGDTNRLRTCAHPDCVLRFYDDSKNGARRWCTMSACGNRAKVAAFLERKKLAK